MTVPIYWILLTLLVIRVSGIAWWYFPVFIFVVWPALTLLATRVCDKFMRELLHCRTNLQSKRSKFLLQERTDLQARLRPLVEELGPELIENWEESRVIPSIPSDVNSLQVPLLG